MYICMYLLGRAGVHLVHARALLPRALVQRMLVMLLLLFVDYRSQRRRDLCMYIFCTLLGIFVGLFVGRRAIILIVIFCTSFVKSGTDRYTFIYIMYVHLLYSSRLFVHVTVHVTVHFSSVQVGYLCMAIFAAGSFLWSCILQLFPFEVHDDCIDDDDEYSDDVGDVVSDIRW